MCVCTEFKQRCNFSHGLKDALCVVVDADFGLLEELRSHLSDREYESMVDYKSYKLTDKLMKIVHWLPKDEFLRALLATGQQHVVNFIHQHQSQQGVSVLKLLRCFYIFMSDWVGRYLLQLSN